MAKVNFDEKGNPTPYGITELSLKEFKNIFTEGTNNTQKRIELFVNYKKYIMDFYKTILKNDNGDWKNWINGSYTTNKKEPNDIDLLNLIDGEKKINENDIQKFLTSRSLQNNDSRKVYSIDAYIALIYKQSDKRYEYAQKRIEYWKKWFGFDRNKNPKGIIQISILNDLIKEMCPLQ